MSVPGLLRMGGEWISSQLQKHGQEEVKVVGEATVLQSPDCNFELTLELHKEAGVVHACAVPEEYTGQSACMVAYKWYRVRRGQRTRITRAGSNCLTYHLSADDFDSKIEVKAVPDGSDPSLKGTAVASVGPIKPTVGSVEQLRRNIERQCRTFECYALFPSSGGSLAHSQTGTPMAKVPYTLSLSTHPPGSLSSSLQGGERERETLRLRKLDRTHYRNSSNESAPVPPVAASAPELIEISLGTDAFSIDASPYDVQNVELSLPAESCRGQGASLQSLRLEFPMHNHKKATQQTQQPGGGLESDRDEALLFLRTLEAEATERAKRPDERSLRVVQSRRSMEEKLERAMDAAQRAAMREELAAVERELEKQREAVEEQVLEKVSLQQTIDIYKEELESTKNASSSVTNGINSRESTQEGDESVVGDEGEGGKPLYMPYPSQATSRGGVGHRDVMDRMGTAMAGSLTMAIHSNGTGGSGAGGGNQAQQRQAREAEAEAERLRAELARVREEAARVEVEREKATSALSAARQQCAQVAELYELSKKQQGELEAVKNERDALSIRLQQETERAAAASREAFRLSAEVGAAAQAPSAALAQVQTEREKLRLQVAAARKGEKEANTESQRLQTRLRESEQSLREAEARAAKAVEEAAGQVKKKLVEIEQLKRRLTEVQEEAEREKNTWETERLKNEASLRELRTEAEKERAGKQREGKKAQELAKDMKETISTMEKQLFHVKQQNDRLMNEKVRVEKVNADNEEGFKRTIEDLRSSLATSGNSDQTRKGMEELVKKISEVEQELETVKSERDELQKTKATLSRRLSMAISSKQKAAGNT
uniref:Uncharacterized protein n=1 Tax=Chromera velia CCMP2878 TaxID=1169474 RepID=A0A0G4FB17_9ALVE|eukprot:Cvel_15987.t1-p1 / transcript=Cvel_15987.t1 / gene=Cvel_15987 / organism=Chromera_velia_CCMP2878 / gene_product=Cingulin-like protein 1, putative / transcript_product=Cingulin-like protein 1, putative / location=Cvel_scaffold1211:15383-25006(-) / protein_length=832 / sequence_SO=supercontig / SO=protein_coding / is_pseudo=false